MSRDDVGRASPIHPLLRAVIEHGPGIHTDADALRAAIRLGDLKAFLETLAQCRDLNSALNDPDSEFWTPLEVAAGFGRIDAIHVLVEHGADVHCHSRYCGGPLFRAFEDSQAESVRLLLQLGADPNGRDAVAFGGAPALVAAVWWAGEARRNGGDGAADREIARALLEYGADVNADDDGRTVLMTAVNNAGPDPELVRLLLEHGADPDRRDKAGQTALDEARAMVDGAVSRGHAPRQESVEILVILEEAERRTTQLGG